MLEMCIDKSVHVEKMCSLSLSGRYYVNMLERKSIKSLSTYIDLECPPNYLLKLFFSQRHVAS